MATSFEFKSSQFEFKAGVGLPDSTQPVFSGIQSVTPQSDGTFVVTWTAATSTKTPVRYEIYVAIGTVSAAALFLTANRVAFAPGQLTSWRVGWLRDQVTYFTNGQIYTFGIRAIDAQSFSESNTVVLTSTAIASGNIGGLFQSVELLLAQDHVNFQADHVNFQNDHTAFQADHAAFVADDAAFVADHANFQSDHTTFQSDHAAFQADHAAFVADDAAFDADHVNFQNDHTAFVADDAAYDTNNANLAAAIVDLETISGGLVSALAPKKLAVSIKSQQKLSIRIKEGT